MTKIRPTQIETPDDSTKYLNGTGAFSKPAGSGGGPAFKRGTLTTGDITVSSTSYVQLSASLSDISIAAATGEVLQIMLSSRWYSPSGGATGILDVVSLVGGSTVHYFSGAGSAGFGFTAWAAPAIVMAIGAPVTYVVQSDDVSGGVVTCRLVTRVDIGSAKLKANSSEPFAWVVTNIGTPEP